jgi:hypothetical protein
MNDKVRNPHHLSFPHRCSYDVHMVKDKEKITVALHSNPNARR